ncbi:TonB-dependent receptor [Niabella terrae]
MAQTRDITGTVSSAQGTALSNVTVAVQGTPRATITDAAGHYTIAAATGEVLEFSSTGYETQQITVTAAGAIDVILAQRTTDLDEVIVVGYGTQKKSNITGAVSNVDIAREFGDRPIADAGRGLQGVVPGLSVRLPDGELGSDPLMRIRGFVGSQYGSSQPLILVDNVEVPSIQLINPNDIASISVLKDASATSIYGAKAAFGVILITTKKGARKDGIELNYSNNLSWQQSAKKHEIAGIDGLQYTLDAHNNMKASGPAGGFWRISEESLQKSREWQEKYGSTVGAFDPVVFERDWYYDGADKFGIRIYDPVKAMIKDQTFSQNHNLSLNGRTGKTTYNAGVGFLGQEGMMKPAPYDDHKRYTANLKLSTEVTDFITIRGGVLFSDRVKRYANSATGFGADPWLYLYRWSRYFPTGVTEHGERFRDPYWDTKDAHTAVLDKQYSNYNFGTTIQLNSNWDIIADYTYDVRQESLKSSMPTFTGAQHWYKPVEWFDENGDRVYVDEEGNITDTGGIPGFRFPVGEYFGKAQSYVYQSTATEKRHTVNAYSTYRLNLNEKNAFKFMLGSNIVANKWDNHYSKRTELISNDKPEFAFAVGEETSGGYANWSSQLGYFGRVNYAFADKYLLEGNLRYDATSTFPAFMRWKWYPSFSAGWVLSEEDFMQDLSSVISFAKFRGSWGSIGDQSVANDLYMPVLDIGKTSWLNSQGAQTFYLGQPRPVLGGLTWQDIVTLNLGADLRFLKGQLGVTFDWFERQTKNMIVAGLTPPNTFGASAPLGNYGNLKTRGWELIVDFNHRFQSGLGINLRANISDAVTDVTRGPDWNIDWANRSVGGSFTTGKRYGDIYGYVTDRLFQKEDFVYDDAGNFVQETIIWEGSAKVTNKLAGANPVYQTYFEDGNQILLISPGDVKFVDLNGDGYITPGNGTFGDTGDRTVIGNIFPRYEYGFRIGLDYKSFDFSVMAQGVGRRHIWGVGQLAIPGYHVKDGAMPQAIAEDYWREDRTNAFYPRAWNLNGSNSGFVMVPQTRYLLNMSYFRIKNITLGYNVAPQILERIRLRQARVFVSLENFITFDKLRGLPIDPEAISGESMLNGNYNLGRTGTSTPVFKIASVGLNISL